MRLKLDIYYTCINGGLVRSASGSAMFSTLEDGKIVEGLAGVPNEGPVLLVGYHMLMGLELSSLVERFLSEKNIMEGAAPKYCTRALSKKDLQEFRKSKRREIREIMGLRRLRD